ncbi:hypothetical protein F385_3115 [Pantoea agglomerans 299R]|nr:hypothetical protein F385_3115 [Pantoea agglomerans 299R]
MIQLSAQHGNPGALLWLPIPVNSTWRHFSLISFFRTNVGL